MRKFKVRGLVRPPFVVAIVAVVGWAGWASDAKSEPRYWAGDISFVTQATYVEAAPADQSAADARPTPSMPPSPPERAVAPEPLIAPRDATDSKSLPPVATDSAGVRPGSLRNEPRPPASDPQLAGRSRQPIGYFGGRLARAAPAAQPRRMPVQPSAPQPVVPRSKHFQSSVGRPTISPYLNLYREENDSQVLPNYYAFVRPQLEQEEANRRQQHELEQLERRGHSAPAAGGPQAGSAPATGRSLPTRFMNTAQFYNGWQR
jgi:hypothetical protein